MLRRDRPRRRVPMPRTAAGDGPCACTSPHPTRVTRAGQTGDERAHRLRPSRPRFVPPTTRARTESRRRAPRGRPIAPAPSGALRERRDVQDEMLHREHLKRPLALASDGELTESHERREPQVVEHGLGVQATPTWHRGARDGADPPTDRRSVGIIQDRTHSSPLPSDERTIVSRDETLEGALDIPNAQAPAHSAGIRPRPPDIRASP
jgi:hypothetical protein